MPRLFAKRISAHARRTPQRVTTARLTARYARELLRLTLKTKSLWALTLAVGAILCTCLALPPGQTVYSPYDRTLLEENARLTLEQFDADQEWLASPSHSPAEDTLKDRSRTMAALAEDLFNAANDRELIQVLARMARQNEQDARARHLVGISAEEYELEARFLERLTDLAEPRIYRTTADMPALTLLTFNWQGNLRFPILSNALDQLLPSSSPANNSTPMGREAYLLLIVPVLAVTVRIVSWRSRALLMTMAPLPNGLATIINVAVATATGCATIALTMLPTITAALTRNGLGDPNYPIAFFRANAPVFTDSAAVLGETAALCAVGVFALASLAELAVRIAHHTIPAATALIAVALLPLLPEYYEFFGPVADVAALLPSTYLYTPKSTGALNYFINLYQNSVTISNVNSTQGLCVLGTFGAICLSASLFAHIVTGKWRQRHQSSPSNGANRANNASVRAERAKSLRCFARPALQRPRVFRAALHVALHGNAAVPAIVCITVICCALPALAPFNLGRDSYVQEAYRAQMQQHARNRAQGPLEGNADTINEQEALLRNVAYATDDQTFAICAASYETWLADQYRQGILAAQSPYELAEAERRAAFFSQLARSSDTALYLRSSDLPALALAGELTRLVPPAAWAACPLCLGIAGTLLRRRGFIRQAPISKFTSASAEALTTFWISAVTLAMSWATATTIALMRNGLGAASYPVTTTGHGVLTAGEAIAQHVVVLIALCLCASCATALIGALIARDKRRRLISDTPGSHFATDHTRN